MLKEGKNIDFYTTGRQPSDQDFTRISEWIRKKKLAAARVVGKTAKKDNSTKAVPVPIGPRKG
jgi:hypothetical protein